MYIAGRYDKKYISNWITNGKNGKVIELELLYKGTRDGFESTSFHSKCDGKFPTLSVIFAEDNLFGGYTNQPWSSPSPGLFKEDPNAFTFSLTKMIKCPIQSDKKSVAVRHIQNVSVYFGATEITISDKANSNKNSYALCGQTYVLPQGSDPNKFYTPSHNFRVEDIEVYKVKI